MARGEYPLLRNARGVEASVAKNSFLSVFYLLQILKSTLSNRAYLLDELLVLFRRPLKAGRAKFDYHYCNRKRCLRKIGEILDQASWCTFRPLKLQQCYDTLGVQKNFPGVSGSLRVIIHQMHQGRFRTKSRFTGSHPITTWASDSITL